MATNYERGRAFEYRTRKRLTEMGARYIMRAASSKGAADLIAFFDKDILVTEAHSLTASMPFMKTTSVPQAWLVQCKMDGKLPKGERETLQALAEVTAARAVLAYKNSKGKLCFKDIVTGVGIIQVVS